MPILPFNPMLPWEWPLWSTATQHHIFAIDTPIILIASAIILLALWFASRKTKAK